MINFKTILVWQRSHKIALEIYSKTRKFPKEEMYGLTSQIRRSAFSVPSNIAEGCGRNTDPELSRFFVIAMGSAAELEYQLLLSKDLEYISLEEYELLNSEIIELRKMLNAFIETVNKRISKK